MAFCLYLCIALVWQQQQQKSKQQKQLLHYPKVLQTMKVSVTHNTKQQQKQQKQRQFATKYGREKEDFFRAGYCKDSTALETWRK